MLALGVDVAVHRGLDLVLLDSDRRVRAQFSRQSSEDLAHVLTEHRPDVVAIDSPPRFGRTGPRLAERELNVRGVKIFYSPTPDKHDDPFYEWMKSGFEAFAAAERAGYPLYLTGHSVIGRAVEVFPHASAIALKECLPPTGWAKSAVSKRSWRTAVLEANGIPVGGLRNLDQVDAALAALTGLMALEGEFFGVGDPDEGIIVLPCRELPARYERDPDEARHTPRDEIVTEVTLVRLEAWADTLRVVLQHVEAGQPVPERLLGELRAVQADIAARAVPPG